MNQWGKYAERGAHFAGAVVAGEGRERRQLAQGDAGTAARNRTAIFLLHNDPDVR